MGLINPKVLTCTLLIKQQLVLDWASKWETIFHHSSRGSKITRCQNLRSEKIVLALVFLVLTISVVPLIVNPMPVFSMKPLILHSDFWLIISNFEKYLDKDIYSMNTRGSSSKFQTSNFDLLKFCSLLSYDDI